MMPKKEIFLEEVGSVLLQKRRGSRNLKISITAQGKVRVSQPYWTPFSTGATFAKGNLEWIKKHLKSVQSASIKNGQLIGKSHRVVFKYVDSDIRQPRARVSKNELIISNVKRPESELVQSIAAKAAERALRQESVNLLTIRLKQLADMHGFKYETLKIKKLTSRWGSCSSKNDISLSFYLIQLPWHLIDYVLLHELVHTVHKNHGPEFWSALEQVQPGAKSLRKELHGWQPKILPTD